MTRPSREITTNRVTAGRPAGVERRPRYTSRTAFSLIDLLVSVTVMAILIGILAPSLAGVTETARRVRCASNIRQIGLALSMYLDQHEGQLPPSRFGPAERDPRNMMVLHHGDDPHNWDGLGFLVGEEFLSASLVFYCPSHTGQHDSDRYETAWVDLNSEIIGNYQFRTVQRNPLGALTFNAPQPDQLTLLSDGLRTRPDYNHGAGNNLLRLDLSVAWYNDIGAFVSGILPASDSELHRYPGVQGAWQTFDTGTPPTSTGGGFGPANSLGVNPGEMLIGPSF